jgi:RNA polymerase sigma-70 factor (ECF subfamily)
MIKATIRVNPGTAANDAVRQSGRHVLLQLDAFRANAAPPPDDHPRALLARVAAGDQRAFEELYRLLSRRVYAFALRITGNAQAAEEVTVDTMHEVWRSASRFRFDAKVSTWVLGIARNKALMTLRNVPAEEHVEIGDYADTLDSGMPDGFAMLAAARDGESIRRGLQALSADHRECLHLAFFDEMSVQEIATVLGIPEGTVKSRLWHAKAQLAGRISALNRQPRPR